MRFAVAFTCVGDPSASPRIAVLSSEGSLALIDVVGLSDKVLGEWTVVAQLNTLELNGHAPLASNIPPVRVAPRTSTAAKVGERSRKKSGGTEVTKSKSSKESKASDNRSRGHSQVYRGGRAVAASGDFNDSSSDDTSDAAHEYGIDEESLSHRGLGLLASHLDFFVVIGEDGAARLFDSEAAVGYGAGCGLRLRARRAYPLVAHAMGTERGRHGGSLRDQQRHTTSSLLATLEGGSDDDPSHLQQPRLREKLRHDHVNQPRFDDFGVVEEKVHESGDGDDGVDGEGITDDELVQVLRDAAVGSNVGFARGNNIGRSVRETVSAPISVTSESRPIQSLRRPSSASSVRLSGRMDSRTSSSRVSRSATAAAAASRPSSAGGARDMAARAHHTAENGVRSVSSSSSYSQVPRQGGGEGRRESGTMATATRTVGTRVRDQRPSHRPQQRTVLEPVEKSLPLYRLAALTVAERQVNRKKLVVFLEKNGASLSGNVSRGVSESGNE